MFTKKKTQTASSMTDNDDLPEVTQHSYVLAKDPFAFGGFSNVYLAKKKSRRPLIKSWYKTLNRSSNVSYGEYVIKVCETDAQKFEKEKEAALKSILSPNNFERGFDAWVALQEDALLDIQVSPLETIFSEVNVMKSLQTSKYVVKLYESFILKPTKQAFIVMERLAANLSDICHLGLLSKPEHDIARRCILNQVVDALCFLKEKQVIHRDIKPSNILLSHTGFVKLCDFGIAIMNEPYIIVDNIVGSDEAMAPEMFIKGQRNDYSVDVWAFGIVVVMCYNQGKGLYAQKPQGYRYFDSNNWKSWAVGNYHFFANFLGYGYTSPEERIEHARAVYTKFDMPMSGERWERSRQYDKEYDTFYEKNYDRVQLLRKCLVPIPKGGPDGKITRSDLLERATIEEVKETKFYQDFNALNELQIRNSINKIVAEYTMMTNEKNNCVNKEITL